METNENDCILWENILYNANNMLRLRSTLEALRNGWAVRRTHNEKVMLISVHHYIEIYFQTFLLYLNYLYFLPFIRTNTMQ